MRVIEVVSMEQCQNERTGRKGDARENPQTSGIVRRDSHVRKSGVNRPGIEPGYPWRKASRLTAQRPAAPRVLDIYTVNRLTNSRRMREVLASNLRQRPRDAERLACSPPTKATRVQSQAGSLRIFRMRESCRTMPLVGWFSRESSVSSALSFRRCSNLTSIIFIGSPDPDIENRPNLFTHSLTRSNPSEEIWTALNFEILRSDEENPPTNGTVRHDYHMRKSGMTWPGIEPGSPWWEASRLTAQHPEASLGFEARTSRTPREGPACLHCLFPFFGREAWELQGLQWQALQERNRHYAQDPELSCSVLVVLSVPMGLPKVTLPSAGHNGTTSGCKWQGKREIPEKTRRPAASSCTIPIRENSGATRTGDRSRFGWRLAV
ncbi:hypothetical protein PR048_022818 [Dryococelus australis]|uniref:Uncharacterized protein n=1 Tax=Dryococelus australis TaxID=614101 RepID=A0ABQ9GSC3_9NEOP|nr:hypothetical protein PR048_022818 [Dryococelus australis]